MSIDGCERPLGAATQFAMDGAWTAPVSTPDRVRRRLGRR